MSLEIEKVEQMSRIFYSLSGEGRGHSTRVRTIIEALRNHHEITLFAPGHAYDLLEPIYRRSPVKVKLIPGMLQYNTDNRLSYAKTGWHSMQYIAQLPGLVRKLKKEINSEKPDLIITDFEPSLPRAAVECGIPFISLNHQHFLVTCDLRSLPLHLKKYSAFMAKIVRSYYKGQKETIISSFYFPPLKPKYQKTIQIGVLLRPEILHIKPEIQTHLVGYLRREPPPNVLEAIEQSGAEVRIYGLGARPSSGLMRFYELNVYKFVEDLAGSRALISTAGNQLIGEALYLGKPVLGLPEIGNYEQEINAHFLCESGGGTAVSMERFSPEHIRSFLDNLDRYQLRFDRSQLNGNSKALEVISRYLPDKGLKKHPSLSFLSRAEAVL